MDLLLGFIIGSAVASASAALVPALKKLYITKNTRIPVIISQSRTYAMISKNAIIIPFKKPVLDTQAMIYARRNTVKILFTENNAYWIKDNNVYRADLDENGTVIEASKKVVDMIGMDKVQLDEMMFIVEKLTEGNDDSWSAGN